jgi:lysophospholipase
MELVETPDNPAPVGAELVRLAGPDDPALRAVLCPAEIGAPLGTVCLFQGRAEFIEKYFETARDLQARGFAVALLDWRGQGGSDRLLPDRRKGHVPSFAAFRADLERFMVLVRARCPKPYFALAHSMGALVALLAERGRDRHFERLVLSAPMLGLGAMYRPTGPARLLANVADALGFGTSYIPTGGGTPIDWQPFEGNPLTSDPVRFARNSRIVERAPALGLGAPTIGWVAASFEAMDAMAAAGAPESVATPVLILAAGDDCIVSNQAIERMAARLGVARTLTIPGARHEILMERDAVRAQALAAFDAFVPGEVKF